MNKFLSIVIPRYKESERDIFPLLSSINGQVGVDLSEIEVVIANDGEGGGPLDEDFLKLFDIDIRQVNLDTNRGPGVARQVGLEAAFGDYIMFCDADDTLHNVGVLGALTQKAKEDLPDFLSSEWMEEVQVPDGSFKYLNHQIETTWMHGKLLRKNFLRKYNIRFHDELRVHEDSYFLSIASAFSERTRHIPVMSYVWKYHPDSITRRNDSIYTFEAFPTFIKACSLSHRELEGSCPRDLMEYKILQFVTYVYFTLQRPEWLDPQRKQYVEASEEVFSIMMAPFWRYWTNASKRRITEVYNQERARTFDGCVERETIDGWIQKMMDIPSGG